MKLWLNGNLVSDDQARIRIDDRGFLLGDGVFETIAVRDFEPLRLDRHLARLAQGLRVCGITPAFSRDDLQTAVRQTADENAIEHGTLRLTISRGPAPRGRTARDRQSKGSVFNGVFVRRLANGGLKIVA